MAAGPWASSAFAQTDLGGSNTTFTNLNGSTPSGITNNGPGNATAIALNNVSTVYNGVIQDGTNVTALAVYAQFTPPAPLPSLTLTGQNTFSGGTQVGYANQSGSLIVGSGGQIGDVSVLYGSALTNQGTIGFGSLKGTAGDVTIDGTSMFTNSGTVNGTISNAGTLTNNSGGTVAGLVTNSGGTSLASPGVSNLGALNGGLTNLAGGYAVNYSGGSITNGVTNAGYFLNAQGGTIGALSNTGGASYNSGSITGTVSATGGGFTNNGTGTAAGLVTNSATVQNYGALNGGLSNSGIATNYAGGTIAGVTNSGTFGNQAGGQVTDSLINNSGATANEGTIAGGAAVSGGILTTTGTISGGVINTATVNAAGTVNGAIQNNGGTFKVNGGNLAGDGSFTNSGTAALFVIGGNFTGLTTITNTSAYSDANGGSIQIGAGKTLSGASLSNGAASGSPVTITDAGSLILSGNVTNYATGVIDVTGTGSLTAASITNLGTINIAAGASTTYYGNLINDSVINMVNGSPTDVTKVYGNYSGDGILKVDINTSTGQSDQLVVTGTALSTNGTTSVYFNVLANGFVVALPVVVTGKGTDAAAFSGSIPDWGTISYSFVPDGNDWVVKSYLNHSFGPLADISGALASISTVFQQPASSYVGDKSNAKVDELFCGTWARTGFDRLTIHSASTVTANGTPVAPLSTAQNINYTAIESGLDCGFLRIDGTAWNAHLGLMGGEIDGSVSQADGRGYTDLHVPVLGGYAFIRNGGFVFDLSVRKSFTDTEFTIAQAGLQKTPVDGIATTTAAYTSYTLEVQKNLLLTPYAGLSWTRSELGDFEIYTNVGGMATGLVAPATNEDSMGRLGFQLSYVEQLTDTFYLRPFAGISGWYAFENSTSLKYFVTNGTVVDVITPTPKDFMQVEGGLSFAENSLQATGYVKGVYKEGPDIRGESLVLGGRLNF